MNQNNAQAITNLQMLIALRHIEKNDLEKILADDYESGARKSFARLRLAEIERDNAADLAVLERLKA
jgi:hypothetical protein